MRIPMKESLHVDAVFHVKTRKSTGEQAQPEIQVGWKWFFLEILAIDLADGKLSSRLSAGKSVYLGAQKATERVSQGVAIVYEITTDWSDLSLPIWLPLNSLSLLLWRDFFFKTFMRKLLNRIKLGTAFKKYVFCIINKI